MKGSLLLEIHGWRGFRTERDLFCMHVVCGFVTLLICRLSVSEKLRDLHDRLSEVTRKLRGDD